jgi:hypothetical protein
MSTVKSEPKRRAKLPPRWVVVGFWYGHRGVLRLTGGRFGLWRPKPNGWGPGEPAWWLNLQAHPDATVRTKDGVRPVTGRGAVGEDRERLWARWQEIDGDLDGFEARRGQATTIVVLEPRAAV